MRNIIDSNKTQVLISKYKNKYKRETMGFLKFVRAWRSATHWLLTVKWIYQIFFFTLLIESRRHSRKLSDTTTNKTSIQRTQYGLEKQISRCCDSREHVMARICLSRLRQIRWHNSNRECKLNCLNSWKWGIRYSICWRFINSGRVKSRLDAFMHTLHV